MGGCYPTDFTGVPAKRWLCIDPPLLPPRNVKMQEALMLEARDICRAAGLRVWLADGALVCIYRDNKLLRHNQDIDYACYAEDIIPRIKTLKTMFLSQGYCVRAAKRDTRLNCYNGGELVSIQGYVKKGKMRMLKNRRVPQRYFGDDRIVFNSLEYPCLGPIEKFLSWRYSNWRKEYSGDSKKRDKYINKKKLMGK